MITRHRLAPALGVYTRNTLDLGDKVGVSLARWLEETSEQ